MPVYDTSNTIDTSIHMKAKLDKNRVGSNYYIENLQNKRNSEWLMRYNVIDIEEELEKDKTYSKDGVNWTPIDVAIRNVKDEKGQDLGIDWANIAFRDLQHPNELGMRYRFSLEHKWSDIKNLSEEDKYYHTSVWITVNKNEIRAGNDCVIRRCNGSLAFVGSPTLSYKDITEIHYEPVILENELKYISFYYNMTVPLPQGEWYATMQLNYYTNSIKVNDRLILGGVDMIDQNNNAVYKVKAIVKTNALNTFSKDDSTEIENIPLCLIALDKDTIDRTGDNFSTRVAEQAPIYLVQDTYPTYKYYITLISDVEGASSPDIGVGVDDSIKEKYRKRILLTEKVEYECNLMFNNNIVQNILGVKFGITACLYKTAFDEDGHEYLTDIPVEDEGSYYKLDVYDNNKFTLQNRKTCNNGRLVITCSCNNPNNEPGYKPDVVGTDDDMNFVITQDFEIELGGFY